MSDWMQQLLDYDLIDGMYEDDPAENCTP